MEDKRVEIRVSGPGYEKLGTMAKKAGLTPELLASVLVQAFLDNDGKVFTGEWDEGPGLRILPDWPRFSAGVIKIKTKPADGKRTVRGASHE
jgi:hypothetical protein